MSQIRRKKVNVRYIFKHNWVWPLTIILSMTMVIHFHKFIRDFESMRRDLSIDRSHDNVPRIMIFIITYILTQIKKFT